MWHEVLYARGTHTMRMHVSGPDRNVQCREQSISSSRSDPRMSDYMTSSIELPCRECETTFAYTQAEQDFRESRGLTQPELCPACRSQDRARRNGDLISLYQRADSFEPILMQNDSAPRGGGFGRGRSDHRTQYTAICAACGSETRVPFIPKGDRPVYCRACFNARRGC
jgi:CxxC-x17-CxxC domain-containing protein